MRKIKLFIACSIDGYIATKSGDIQFLDQAAIDNEDYGYEAFMSHIDTVIMGRKTYDKIKSFDVAFPHLNEAVYVFSKTRKGSNDEVTFVNDDAPQFLHALKQQPGKDIFLDGGAQLIHTCLHHQLIDEMIISIIPICLGDGIPLFLPSNQSQTFVLINHKAYQSGVIQLTYQKSYQ